ncbi:hypothetical protein [Brevundimonas sp. NIBR11]|uniref:hypothetical protein n=1 Tax=Brevundimonas sp. NIBR11 TaxID=3015999 RepID=UPI0022F0A30F|nr:hypothetical protein [Brevundimonas sp. NIBR11]WGM30224.1 hypothetical protein KKHFBJBL_00440 [Brevundimonas sp. NIBR11]
MAANYIVVRRSPHWPTFDLADSRPFCEANGLPAGLIVDFARRWDAVSRLDFLSFRQAMKTIAHQTLVATGAKIIDARDLDAQALADDDALIPIDDDDWLHPDVFERTREAQAAASDAEGCLWGSIFVGKLFGDTPKQGRLTPFVYRRELDDIAYTNNYMVTGHAWKTRGAAVVFDHGHAEDALRDGRLPLARSDTYSSAANKHLCATTCVFYNTRTPGFVESLPEAISRTIEAAQAAELTPETGWTAPMIGQLSDVMRQCLP